MSNSTRTNLLMTCLLSAWMLGLQAAEPALESRYGIQTAESGENLAGGLTPAEAVRIALKKNRELVALRKGLDIADGRLAEARAFADPEIRTGSLNFDDDWVANRSYNVGVRWSPPRPGERKKKANQAKGWASEIEADIGAAEQSLAAEVRLLHMNIVFLDEQIKLAETAVGVRDRILAFVDRQVDAGAKSILDRGMAELALADARSVPASLRLDRQISLQNLRQKLNVPRSAELGIRANGDPLSLPPPSVEEDLAPASLKAHAELAAVSARCSQLEAQLGLRRAERYPWLSFVQVNHEFGWEDVSDSWGFRLGVDIPISRWSRRMTMAPAAAAEQCQLELEAVSSRIGLEVDEITARLQARRSELENYKTTLEPLANRDLELSERIIAAGQGDALGHLTAEARLLRLQQDYLERLLDFRRLEIELDRAMGNAVLP